MASQGSATVAQNHGSTVNFTIPVLVTGQRNDLEGQREEVKQDNSQIKRNLCPGQKYKLRKLLRQEPL